MATYESKKYAIPGANITNIAATAVADGSVTDSEYQFINTLASNAQTQITAKLPKAGGTMTGGIVFPDDSGPAPAKVSFGAGDDLRVFSDGTTGFLKGNDIRVVNSSDVEMIKAASGGAVDLRHNGTTRVSTSGSGATINGTLSATTVSATTVSAPTGSFTNVSGNGSSITSINGSNISSGTVADARISSLTASKLTGPLPAIDASSLTGLPSSVATGVTDVGAIQLCYYDISNSTASISRGSTTSGANLKVVPTSDTQFSYGTFQISGTPSPAAGTAIGSGTWLALTGTTTANVNVSGGDQATRYGPGLFIRVS